MEGYIRFDRFIGLETSIGKLLAFHERQKTAKSGHSKNIETAPSKNASFSLEQWITSNGSGGNLRLIKASSSFQNLKPVINGSVPNNFSALINRETLISII